jgi:hypothetical protein
VSAQKEFHKVDTCRFSDANCVPQSKGAAKEKPAAAKPAAEQADCATRDDLSGLAVAVAPFAASDADLSKGRLIKIGFSAVSGPAVHARIRVWWPAMKAWYDGVILRTAVQDGKAIYLIKYEEDKTKRNGGFIVFVLPWRTCIGPTIQASDGRVAAREPRLDVCAAWRGGQVARCPASPAAAN